MSPIPSTREKPDRCTWVESSARPLIPSNPKTPLNGAPQMVELSRDGKRIYFTNSLYTPWDAQFYPEGIQSWMVKLDAKPEGGMEIDPKFFVDFGELRESPGPSGRRRRFFRLILLRMSEMTWELTSTTLWPTLFLLGAYHGINPGMGWLFAVARGMQEHRARAVAWSLPPIALGHALAIGVVVLVQQLAQVALPLPYIRIGVAVTLVGLGV